MKHIEAELARTKAELCEAYDLLNMFREFIHARKSPSFGNVIFFDDIYNHEYHEIVAELMNYYGLSTEEDDEDA